MPPRGRKRTGPRRVPDASRAAILQAAIREFARKGVAGARTDAIARSAGVNKALLYYYFRDKNTLYGAALDHVLRQRLDLLLPVLREGLSPKETILRYAGALFDYFAEHPAHREIVQREILMPPRHPASKRAMRRYFTPLFEGLRGVIENGIAAGDFRPVDPTHFVLSMGAVVVQYFAGASFLKLLEGGDPLSAGGLEARRAAVLDFIAAALFRPSPPKRKGARS